jgi:hypothetical protein
MIITKKNFHTIINFIFKLFINGGVPACNDYDVMLYATQVEKNEKILKGEMGSIYRVAHLNHPKVKSKSILE